MKKSLTFKEIIFVSSMLFGMFFGAGNLIFPVYMGQIAGKNVFLASIGFLLTGVGLPLLAIIALAQSRSNGCYELCLNIGKRFSIFFTTALYVAIGPGIAIPRCATVPYAVSFDGLVSGNSKMTLFLFSLIFFCIVLFFSLKPGKILDWVGKILNPIFLVFLTVLIGRAIIKPMDNFLMIEPIGVYSNAALSTGFFEGYNTLDALAGLAFGIVVIDVVKGLGVTDSKEISKGTSFAGIYSCVLMAIIYIAIAIVGAQSRNVLGECQNGGEVFARIAKYYFGSFGSIILSITVTVACLKTAIGLVTSCSSMFEKMFPFFKQKTWAYIFCVVSLIIANFGLNVIVSFSVPVLMFLYPLAIVIIFMHVFLPKLSEDGLVMKLVVYSTIFPAIIEFIVNLPISNVFIDNVKTFRKVLPLGEKGFAFVVFALLGLAIAFVLRKRGEAYAKNCKP